MYNFGSRRYGRNYDLFYVSTEAGRGCGGTLYNTRGVVTSPDYPRPHAQASNCEWTLKVPPGQRIQLRFAGKYMCNTYYSKTIQGFRYQNRFFFRGKGQLNSE